MNASPSVNSSTNPPGNSLFIVDGYSILFRVYYSAGEMFTSNKTPIGGVFGFIRTIFTLIHRYHVEDLAITLDSGKKTFRAEIYTEYKANRVQTPETLIPQFEILQEFLIASNLCFFKEDGYEADDIIATITKLTFDKKTVVTADKDLMQLVDGKTSCLDFFKNKEYKTADVVEKFGIEPQFIADYLSLVGDSSDNIPGVKGCGPKNAVKLINQFGSVENILANISQIANEKTKTMLENYKEDALLSKRLASLNFQAPITFHPTKTKVANIDIPKTREFLEKYEMKSLIGMLGFLEKNVMNIEKNVQHNNIKDPHDTKKQQKPTQGLLF